MDPVIIAGAGPVGLTLALSLARLDVPCILLDDAREPGARRPARSAVLQDDTAALVSRLTGTDAAELGAPLAGWRLHKRRQEVRKVTFGDEEAGTGVPLHLTQDALTSALRAQVDQEPRVQLVPGGRVDAVEQEDRAVTVHTTGGKPTWWRGSHLVGCDGPRSTVRKLLGVRFPGRTAVERHAVAALRTELPWNDEALLHRRPAWRGDDVEVCGRPLPGGIWRLDWLLPAGDELVTPEALVARIRRTLAGWNEGTTPAYELLDTGVHTVHHRLARNWRVGRVLLAGDAAHLLGALGTHGLDEGLRDAGNLAWKLAFVLNHGAGDALLDSYQQERRSAVAARLRAADQALPVVRGSGGLRSYVPGSGRENLLADGHLGRGPLGSPAPRTRSPLTPAPAEAHSRVSTEPGAPVAEVRVTTDEGAFVPLRDRLGRASFLVLLVAPGTKVWDRRHWMRAGLMPRLAAAVAELPVHAEVLVCEDYPGAAPHTVLLVRPDGRLVAAFGGVHPAELRVAALAALGRGPRSASDAEGVTGAADTQAKEGSGSTGARARGGAGAVRAGAVRAGAVRAGAASAGAVRAGAAVQVGAERAGTERAGAERAGAERADTGAVGSPHAGVAPGAEDDGAAAGNVPGARADGADRADRGGDRGDLAGRSDRADQAVSAEGGAAREEAETGAPRRAKEIAAVRTGAMSDARPRTDAMPPEAREHSDRHERGRQAAEGQRRTN